MFEHALHTNIRTFEGTFRLHNCLQTPLSATIPECSTWSNSLILCATWYADLTENFWDLFSFQTSLSREYNRVSGNCKISIRVLWANRSNIFSLSHCLVVLSIRSFTNKLGRVSPRKNWFMCQPFMFWNFNVASIPYLPFWTFLDDISSCQKTSPNVWRIAASLRIHKWAILKIYWLIHPIEQRVNIMNQSPSLFS